jgi:hypothetical protein
METAVNRNQAFAPLADATPQAAPPGADAARPPADAAEEPPPFDDPRDELLASLGRRFRGASLKLEFELRTTVARQVFQRDFVYVSRQLHALEASRRVQGIDRQLLRGALAAIAQRADAARTLLLLRASEARALIAYHAHGQADVAFARPTRLQATIVSPHARDFLDILAQADDALSQLEKAWLLGLLEPPTKARHAVECRRELMAYKETVRHQRHVVGTHVREVNAARRQALQTVAANQDHAAPDAWPAPQPSATLQEAMGRRRSRNPADEADNVPGAQPEAAGPPFPGVTPAAAAQPAASAVAQAAGVVQLLAGLAQLPGGAAQAPAGAAQPPAGAAEPTPASPPADPAAT